MNLDRKRKRLSLLLWDAIKKERINDIEEIMNDPNYPIDYPVTDTGLSAISFACSWSTN